jgi:clan AA aspartic protease (TIGR02281 family)
MDGFSMQQHLRLLRLGKALALAFCSLGVTCISVASMMSVALYGLPKHAAWAISDAQAAKSMVANSPNQTTEAKQANEATPTQNDTNTYVLPIEAHPNSLQVDIKLAPNCKGAFLLDTGATYTSISSAMAKKLGVSTKLAPTLKIATANGVIEVPIVTLKQMKVGHLTVHNVKATVMDLGARTPYDGLLGLSFLERFKTTLDAKNQKLVLSLKA